MTDLLAGFSLDLDFRIAMQIPLTCPILFQSEATEIVEVNGSQHTWYAQTTSFPVALAITHPIMTCFLCSHSLKASANLFCMSSLSYLLLSR